MQEMPEDMMLSQAYSFIHAAEVKSPEPIKGFYQRLALLQVRVWMRQSGAEEEIRILQEIAVLVSNSLNNIKVKGLTGKEISFRFCPIPAGTFLMNMNEIKIDQGFYLGTYPVTQEQWEAIMGYNPSYFKGDMTGNVWEWTDRLYNSSNHVIRGGRWSNLTEEYRLGFHGYSAPGNQLETIGFRLLLVR